MDEAILRKGTGGRIYKIVGFFSYISAHLGLRETRRSRFPLRELRNYGRCYKNRKTFVEQLGRAPRGVRNPT